MICYYRRSLVLYCIVLLGAGVAVSGCSGPKSSDRPTSIPSAFPNHSGPQIRTLIQQSADTVHSYRATARVAVRTPEENRSFNAQIRQARSDSLFMRFTLFGMEGGRLLLTRDSVFLYNHRERTMRIGPLADAQRLFPAPVQSDRIFANMLGLIAPKSSTDWTVDADSSLYYLSDPTDTRHWVVDPRRWRVIRFTKKADDGTVLEKRHFSKFQRVGEVVIPHQIIFRRPPEDLMGRIQYKDIRLNPSALSFALDVPSSIPRRPLR